MNKRLLAASVLSLTVLGIGGFAYASIPAANGDINGCYKTSSPHQGELLVRDSGATCPAGYTDLTWPSQDTNTVTTIGWKVVSDTAVNVGPGTVADTVACPSGWYATGGGFFFNPAAQGTTASVTTNSPASGWGPEGTAWQAGGTATGLGDFKVYAICESGVTP